MTPTARAPHFCENDSIIRKYDFDVTDSPIRGAPTVYQKLVLWAANNQSGHVAKGQLRLSDPNIDLLRRRLYKHI